MRDQMFERDSLLSGIAAITGYCEQGSSWHTARIFLIHVSQSVTEESQRFLLSNGRGACGVDEAVQGDALLFGY